MKKRERLERKREAREEAEVNKMLDRGKMPRGVAKLWHASINESSTETLREQYEDYIAERGPSGRTRRDEARKDAIEQRGSLWSYRHAIRNIRTRDREDYERPGHAVPPAVKRRRSSTLRQRGREAVELVMLLERCRTRVTSEDVRIFRSFANVGIDAIRTFSGLVRASAAEHRPGSFTAAVDFASSIPRARAAGAAALAKGPPASWPVHIPWPGRVTP